MSLFFLALKPRGAAASAGGSPRIIWQTLCHTPPGGALRQVCILVTFRILEVFRSIAAVVTLFASQSIGVGSADDPCFSPVVRLSCDSAPTTYCPGGPLGGCQGRPASAGYNDLYIARLSTSGQGWTDATWTVNPSGAHCDYNPAYCDPLAPTGCNWYGFTNLIYCIDFNMPSGSFNCGGIEN